MRSIIYYDLYASTSGWLLAVRGRSLDQQVLWEDADSLMGWDQVGNGKNPLGKG